MKTRKPLISLTIFFVLYTLLSNSSDSNINILVVLPPELKNSPNESYMLKNQNPEKDKIRQNLLNKIPSVPEGYILRTFGQLTKQADSIIIGTVKKIIKKPKPEGMYTDIAYEFKVNVVTNLYGHTREETFNLKYSNEALGSGVSVDDCVLLFLSHGEPPFDFNVLRGCS